MRVRKKVLALAIVTALVAVGLSASAALRGGDPRQETGPVYSVEGAWYGMTDIAGMAPVPSLDTLAANAHRTGVAGSFLCTIPDTYAVLSSFGLKMTTSAHGNWVRIGTNQYAFTAVRTIVNAGTGVFVGWARHWGTITAASENELTGTMNVQFYLGPNATPMFPEPLTGVLERHRIGITYEP